MTLGGVISGAFLARNLENEWWGNHQAALKEAAMAGEAWLLDESGGPGHTPIDTGDLISTVEVPVENQFSVTFKIKGVLTDPHSGRPGRPYGFAQEFGYHDRSGGFHEGHHMVRTAVEKAAEAYLAFIGHGNVGIASKLAHGVSSSDRSFTGFDTVAGSGTNPGLPF
jgi:hypothetical protein